MGVGDPASMIEAINLGVDQFDCVMQTRLGRHGTALTGNGRVNIKRSEFALSDAPIDADCTCWVCGRHSRGYIRHLFKVGEPTASRLVSVHNVAWTVQLMHRHGQRSSTGRSGHSGHPRSPSGDDAGPVDRSVGSLTAMYSSSLLASGDSSSGGSPATLLIFLLIPVAMYFLMIRPQRKRMKETAALQSTIDVGDEVVTNSGIYGFVTGVDGDKFWLEIDDDVQIRISRAAIQGHVNAPVADTSDDDAPTDKGSRRKGGGSKGAIAENSDES